MQQSSLITEIMIQKNVKGLERMEVLITSHLKVFLSNKYYSYILLKIQRQLPLAMFLKKNIIKRKKKGFQRPI